MTISPIIRPVISSVINQVIGDGGFYPNQLANAAIGLDAFVIPSSTTLVSSWTNRGNVGVADAVQATALRQPLYVANGINGRPALRGRHDGVNASQLNIADGSGLDYTQFTAYVVYQREVDTGGFETIAGKWNANDNTREHLLSIGADDFMIGQMSANGIASPSISVSGALTQTTGVARIARLQYNGSQFQLQTVGATGFQSAYSGAVFNGVSPFTLFARPNFASPFTGLIGEFWFFTRSLTATERTLMENYLAAKWGIV